MMTPEMISALSAADLADCIGGLMLTSGGWVGRDLPVKFHRPEVVHALVELDYLSARGSDSDARRSITFIGRKKLVSLKEQMHKATRKD